MEVSLISVSGANTLWQSLERKLRRGKSLERAASECGIDIEEARRYLETTRENRPFDNDSLRITAGEMLHYGVKTLIELTKIRDGRLGGEGLGEGASTKWDHPDLPAAQALVTGAIKIYSMIDPKKGRAASGAPGADDLFDGAADKDGNWTFPDKN